MKGPGLPITLRVTTGAPSGVEPVIRCALIRRSDPATAGA